jgi:maleylacetate reductase
MRSTTNYPGFVHQSLANRVVFGAGVAHRRVAAEIDRLNATRVIAVGSARSLQTHADVLEALGERLAHTFSEIKRHVPRRVADAATAAAADVGADAVLAIGGGSTIGTAKAVALATGLPIVAIPTTYAGSEVTPVWGITDNGDKRTGRDPVVLPRTVLYDVERTAALPMAITVASAMNAMAHCIDSLWAANATPLALLQALRAIELIAAALPMVHSEPSHERGRHDLLLGAWLAGTAFAVAGSAIHHKICHVLGGRFDLPHAQTHAVLLPHVIAFNAADAPDADASIARAFGAAHAARALQDMNARFGVPASLEALGVTRDAVLSTVDAVLRVVPDENPAPIDTQSVTGLLLAAWQGETID